MRNSFKALELAQDEIVNLESLLLKRKLRATESPCDIKALVDGRELKAFCSNDYLGLANHPDLIAALAEGADRYGVGSGASHLISGHSLAHELLEKELSAFQNAHIPNARSLFFSTGYLTNLTAITTLAKLVPRGDTSIYSARLNHASLIDGIRLANAQSHAKVMLFDHTDLNTVDELLAADKSPLKMIVTDGVFSMDGDLAPVNALLTLAEKYDALLLVDDAHGFGVLGKLGHGILEQENISSERIIYIGTLGKAAGVSGAFVCAHTNFIEWLIQKGRPFIYSTATPPAIAHTLSKSLKIIEGEDGIKRRNYLNKLISIWQDEMQFAQWGKISSCTAIQPVILGSNANALLAAKLLDEAGYWIPAIRPPTVPHGSARLRITFSANHSEAEVRRLISTLQSIEQQVIQKAEHA